MHPEVQLVLSHQYLDYQTPPHTLAQIRSAVIKQEIEKNKNKQIKHKIHLK